MKQYGALIVGTGWVAPEHIRSFKMNPNARVAAIVSRSAERGRAVAEMYSVPEAAVYTDYDKALEDPNVDIVVLCTPNYMHADQTIKAAQAGKHILIEKPLDVVWEKCLAMKDAVDKAGVKTLVSYVLRWNELFMTVKRMQEEYLGKLYYAETDYLHHIPATYNCYDWITKKATGGGALHAGGCHAIDGLRWFVQQEATEVFAYSNAGRKDMDYDGTVVLLIKFADGLMGKIASSFDVVSPYVYNLHLFGEKGTLYNDRLYSPSMLEGQQDFMRIPVKTPDSGDVEHHPFPQEVAHFVDCIIQDKKTIVDIDDALKTQEIAFAADVSARTGKPVGIPFK